MNIKRNILWVIIGVLVVMNGFLLYTNIKKNRRSQQIKDMRKSNSSLSSARTLDFPNKVDISLIKANLPVQLLTIFPKENCTVCIEIELPWLKKIAQKYPKLITIVDIGMQYDLKSMIGSDCKLPRKLTI